MSDTDSDTSSSNSSSDSDDGFTKKVVFKKRSKADVVVEKNDFVEKVIAKNNSRISEKSNVVGEAALVQHLDDSTGDNDYEEWKERELKRLQRDRLQRIEREQLL